MQKIYLKPNKDRLAFSVPNDYSKGRLQEWLKKYDGFWVEPDITDSIKGRRFLEGAIVPEYCKFQYNIDPRDPNKDEARRLLFKRDFNYEIITDRNGNPERVPLSTKGLANEVSNKFTEWATENGCPIPNVKLYKEWRDKWKLDGRFPTFHDFLKFLNLECDAMPSAETMKLLEPVNPIKVDYPEDIYNGEAPTI